MVRLGQEREVHLRVDAPVRAGELERRAHRVVCANEIDNTVQVGGDVTGARRHRSADRVGVAVVITGSRPDIGSPLGLEAPVESDQLRWNIRAAPDDEVFDFIAT